MLTKTFSTTKLYYIHRKHICCNICHSPFHFTQKTLFCFESIDCVGNECPDNVPSNFFTHVTSIISDIINYALFFFLLFLVFSSFMVCDIYVVMTCSNCILAPSESHSMILPYWICYLHLETFVV